MTIYSVISTMLEWWVNGSGLYLSRHPEGEKTEGKSASSFRIVLWLNRIDLDIGHKQIHFVVDH
jgi:hypothetical protein